MKMFFNDLNDNDDEYQLLQKKMIIKEGQDLDLLINWDRVY